MEFWTTFTPKKIAWELTSVSTKGKKPTYNWIKNIHHVKDSLFKLKKSGIVGIRLVIYPSELSIDALRFNFRPIEKILDICMQFDLKVDLCIGPFQYPNYPGIYLPDYMLENINKDLDFLDSNLEIRKYSEKFLKLQLNKFGDDKRLHGFHLANEWPDWQKIEGRRNIKLGISKAYMLDVASFLVRMTKKSISLNTNINPISKREIKSTFSDIFEILSTQGQLGFDIYPTQEKWGNNPYQRLKSMLFDYSKAFRDLQKKYSQVEIYFAEVEAQPWGSGQSWYEMINKEPDVDQKILNYEHHSLSQTFEKYIKNSGAKIISLWGCDFWIAADMMGVKWPLNQIKKLNEI